MSLKYDNIWEYFYKTSKVYTNAMDCFKSVAAWRARMLG